MQNRTRAATRATLAAAALLAMSGAHAQAATLDKEAFGTTTDGKAVDRYTMTNDRGMRVQFLELSAARSPRSTCRTAMAGSTTSCSACPHAAASTRSRGAANYFGAIVGRYANRIAGGKFSACGPDLPLAAITARTRCMAA